MDKYTPTEHDINFYHNIKDHAENRKSSWEDILTNIGNFFCINLNDPVSARKIWLIILDHSPEHVCANYNLWRTTKNITYLEVAVKSARMDNTGRFITPDPNVKRQLLLKNLEEMYSLEKSNIWRSA